MLIEPAKSAPGRRRDVIRHCQHVRGVSGKPLSTPPGHKESLLNHSNRLAATCCYEYVFTAPTTAVVDPATYGSSGSPNEHHPGAPRHSIFDPDLEIPASMVMNLLSSKGIAWRESVELYFQTTNLWLSAVHQERFFQKLGSGNEIPQDPGVALLIVCMHLVTQYADSGKPIMPDGTEMLSLPAYVVAKRVLGLLRALGAPTVELVQCAALLCLFEFGHGDFMRAYVTIGDAYTTAKSIDVRPGKFDIRDRDRLVSAEESERRDLYWTLLIVDRYV